MNLQIACVITAAKKAKIVYTIAKTKKLASNTAKVTIKKIAKNVASPSCILIPFVYHILTTIFLLHIFII